MTLTEQVAKNIIRKLLRGDDYRIEVVTLIDAEFLQFAIDFFKKIVDAKLQSKSITADWYKDAFLNPNLPSSEIAINSGLNKKTIHNMFNSSTREIIIDASNQHYDVLYKSIQELVKTIKDKEEVKKQMEKWLKKQKCSEFDTKQILNDLTSYKEFLEL